MPTLAAQCRAHVDPPAAAPPLSSPAPPPSPALKPHEGGGGEVCDYFVVGVGHIHLLPHLQGKGPPRAW